VRDGTQRKTGDFSTTEDTIDMVKVKQEGKKKKGKLCEQRGRKINDPQH